MKSYAYTCQRCLSVWACGIAISRRPAIKKSGCGWKKQHVASVMNPSKLSLYGKFGTKTDGFTDEGSVDHSAGDGAHDQFASPDPFESRTCTIHAPYATQVPCKSHN